MDQPKKARRRLTDISFEHEGAHLALCSKEQGAANGHQAALVMKATAQFSEEFIEKIQGIKVHYELDDFLESVMGLYEDNAKLLAAMMGYKEEPEGEGEPVGTYSDDCFWEWWKDQVPEGKDPWMVEPTDADYQTYIDSRLAGLEIIKSTYAVYKESGSIAEAISQMNETSYLTLLKDQERLEKALVKKELVEEALLKAVRPKTAVVAEKKKPKAKIVSKASSTGHKAEPAAEAGIDAKAVAAEPKRVAKATQKLEVNNMTVDTVKVEELVEKEMVEKAQYESIAKALEDQRVELEKATALIAQFQAEKKEAIAKARKAELVAAVEQEEKAEALFKAVGELSDEAFASVVDVVKSLSAKIEADPMFNEQGNPTESEVVQKSALRAKLEAKYKK